MACPQCATGTDTARSDVSENLIYDIIRVGITLERGIFTLPPLPSSTRSFLFKIMRERQLAAEEAASAAGGTGGGANDSAYSGAYSSKSGKGGVAPTPGAKRKASAAERIGVGKAR